MRILIATDTYYPNVNGSSYFSQRLAHYLHERGHDVAVVAPSESMTHTQNQINGITVFGVRSFPIVFYPGFRFCLPFGINKNIQQAMTQFSPDIVHLQMHIIVGRAVSKIAHHNAMPIVATNHFMPDNLIHYLRLPKSIKNIINDLAWNDCAAVFDKAHHITTPTETAAMLMRGRLKKPIRAISNGIDLERFNPTRNGDYLLARYKIPRKPILLYVGRLDKEKNLDLVIKASALAFKHVDFHLVIAGTGAEKNKLIKLADSLGVRSRITFTGFVPDEDLPNLYVIAKCFVSAGTAELQSIVTMEAMATGLPIIAVNAVALPELVINGRNGFLFEPDDDKALAQHIERIFSDEPLRKRMGEESLNIIAEHDISKTINAFEEIYKTLLSQINS